MSKVQSMLHRHQSGRGDDNSESSDLTAPPAGTKRAREADSEPALPTKRSKAEWDNKYGSGKSTR